MKKLTQATFKDVPDWVKSAAVDSNSNLHVYSVESKWLTFCGFYHHAPIGSYAEFFDDEYDTNNWQNSAIDREVAK